MRVDKDRICQEAIVLANRGGLDDLSMNDLALALKIRSPSLYSHVAGINDVKRLLALHGLELLERSVAQATIGKSGAEAVASALNAYRDFVKANPGVYAAMVPTPPRSDREWSGAVDRLMDTLLASLREYGLQGSELIHALRGLRSLVHGFVSLEIFRRAQASGRSRRKLRLDGRIFCRCPRKNVIASKGETFGGS